MTEPKRLSAEELELMQERREIPPTVVTHIAYLESDIDAHEQHASDLQERIAYLEARVEAAEKMANVVEFAWLKLHNPGEDPLAIKKAKDALASTSNAYRATAEDGD